MEVVFDTNDPICVECGNNFKRAIRSQGGGSLKIYCTAKCRANSWARGNTEKRKISVIKYDRKPESVESKKLRARIARFRKYSLTEDIVVKMLAQQNQSCRGCTAGLTLETAQIDHCHTTGYVRGLLCTHCNWALGHAKDDPTILINLAEYLSEQIVCNRKSSESVHSCFGEEAAGECP